MKKYVFWSLMAFYLCLMISEIINKKYAKAGYWVGAMWLLVMVEAM